MTMTAEVEDRALTIPERASALQIVTARDYEEAANLLLSIKEVQKEIDASYDPVIKKAFEAHREAIAAKKKVEAPLREAEAIIKPKLSAYDAEQERIRLEAERKAQAEAVRLEEERRLQEAIEAEQSGDTAEADAIIASPAYVAPVSIPKTTPKVQGITYRETWNYEITDINKLPREYLKPDEVKIGQVVRALRSAARIPGIRVYSSRTVAAGRR